jgi:23S rRNA pseudouridine1911/1915/1917 synthase
LVHYLARDEKRNKAFVSDKARDGYLRAELTYELIASSLSYHLLEVNLITGRHHQIRSQLAAIGSPIRGDLKYGFARSNGDGSISLHAHSLSFIHPVTLQTLTISAGPPKSRVWSAFMNILKMPQSGTEEE